MIALLAAGALGLTALLVALRPRNSRATEEN